MPKGRSFQSLAMTAPSVNSGEIEGGFQVNGASGAENAFTVDGVVTNSLINGSSRQNTVFEYLQEVQVKTTGIAAEYGGALGGVISAVTKSGGNTFRGEAHYLYEGSSLSAGPVKRLVLDPSDDVTRDATSRTPRRRITATRSAGRSAVRSSRTSCSSSGPTRRGSPAAPTTTAFSNGTEHGRDQAQPGPDAVVRQGDLQQPAASRRPARRSTRRRRLKARCPPTTAPARTSSPARWRPTRSTCERGFEQTQTNASGNVDIVAVELVVPVGPRRLLLRQLQRHGHPEHDQLHLSDGRRSAWPASRPSCRGPISTQNTPRALIVDKDATDRSFFNVDYNNAFHAAGYHTLKAGFG